MVMRMELGVHLLQRLIHLRLLMLGGKEKPKGGFVLFVENVSLFFFGSFHCPSIDVFCSGSAYTSMLRLTTTAPSLPVIHGKGDGDGSGSEDEGEVEAPRHDPTDNNTNNNNSQGGIGGFGFLNGDASGGAGFFRTGFLRTFSTLGRERPADVENQIPNPSSTTTTTT